MTQTSLTRCPNCQTTFRLTATQLKKAKGKVRCGSCAHVFDARNYLLDSPATPTQPTAKPTPAPKKTPTPPANTSGHHDEFFDLAAKPAPEPAPTPAPATRPPASKQTHFMDSIVDERSRYNNLDNLGKIHIPGEIHDGMQSINRPKETLPTPKPAATPPPAPPPVSATPKTPPKPTSKKNPYEDVESKEKPTSIDDLEGINAL